MDLHLKYLSNMCRCCGFEQSKSMEMISKTSALVSKYFSMYNNLNLSEESNNIYPLYLCSICLLNFQKQYTNYVSGNNIEVKMQLAKFEEHKRENCLICSYHVADENCDPLYFNREHMRMLSKCCRICKCISVKFKGQENHKCSGSFNKVLDSSIKLTLSKENIYIYPQYFCQSCCQVIAMPKIKFNFDNFSEHSNNCNICKNFSKCENEILLNNGKLKIEFTDTESISPFKDSYISSPLTPAVFQSPVPHNLKEKFDFIHYSLLALKLHKEKLRKFCRLCAKPQSIYSSKNKMESKFSPDILEYFSIFFHVNVATEDPDIYPPNICYICCSKLQQNLQAKLKKKKVTHKLQLSSFFEKFQHKCKICLFNDDQSNIGENNFSSSQGVNNDCVVNRKHGLSEPTNSYKRLKPCASLQRDIFYGLPVEQLSFESKNEGKNCFCCNCFLISDSLIIASCQHLYCETCSQIYISTNSICCVKSCHSLLHFGQSDLKTLMQRKIADLTFECLYCNLKGSLKDTISHEESCDKRKTLDDDMDSINKSNSYPFVRMLKLAPLKSVISKLCLDIKEDFKDSISYLLWDQFKEDRNIQAAEYIRSLKRAQILKWDFFSTEECLALKCMFLKTSDEYEKEYNYVKLNYDLELLKPIKELESSENKYFPSFACYKILDFFGSVLFKKESLNKILVNSGKTFDKSSETFLTFGAHWNYIDCIASTIYELSYLFVSDIDDADNQISFVEIKDSMQQFQIVENSLRASFCVLTIYCFVKGVKKTLYSCSIPNFYKNNRDFLIASWLDEESYMKEIFKICNSIEKEKASLKHRLLDIKLYNNKFYRFCIKVYSTIYNDQLNNLIYGLPISTSSSFCSTCGTSNENWLAYVRDYDINATSTFTSKTNWHKVYKHKQIWPKSINARNWDINLAKVFREIIECETACVYKTLSNCSLEEKKKLNDAIRAVDDHFLNKFGLKLQEKEISVHSTNKFFEVASTNKALEIINKQEQKNRIKKLLYLFTIVQTVYNATEPTQEEVTLFRQNAIQFTNFLLDHFEYIMNSNVIDCLHNICEHGHEILKEEPYSIGILSSAGLESGCLLFRKLWNTKLDEAMNDNKYGDILKESWLHTSPRLHNIGVTVAANYLCTFCGIKGHSPCTCPLNNRLKKN